MLKRFRTQLELIRKKNTKGDEDNSKDESEKEELSKSLAINLEKIRETLGISNDVVIREFNIGLNSGTNAAAIFIDGIVNKEIINDNIMRTLLIDSRRIEESVSSSKRHLLDVLRENIVSASELKEIKTFNEIIDGIFSGETVVLIDGYDTALQLGTRGWDYRAISEPQTEAVVRGPREGFTETLRVNTALMRRKIKDPNLVFEAFTIGKVTKTDVCVAYVRGIVNDKIVKEVRKRLGRIDIDGILESGYIEQLIEDAPFSIFATVGNVEKPDITAAKLLEGKVAILTDGTPVVLIVPYLFVDSLQNSEDYYSRPWYSTMIRWVRFFGLFITVFLPAVYIVSQSYHHEMIPTVLLITMAAAKAGVPFPVLVETILMGLTFEILREAGIRMPKAVGQAVSIVGALVLGQAAVEAGIVSAPSVIVIALTAISGFLISSQTDAISIMRFFFMILAGISGLFGMLWGMILILIHLVSLRSFGVPYLSPVAPNNMGEDLKDVIMSAPLWMRDKRPPIIGNENPVRQGENQKPEPPKKDGN